MGGNERRRYANGDSRFDTRTRICRGEQIIDTGEQNTGRVATNIGGGAMNWKHYAVVAISVLTCAAILGRGETKMSGTVNTLVYTEYPTNAYFCATNRSSYCIEEMREYGTTNIVKTLGDAGEICAVYGHVWPTSWTENYGGCKCRICGKQKEVVQ
jgi:hypothetical protein